MSKEGFIKRHSYILTTGAILGALTMHQCKDITINFTLNQDNKNISQKQIQTQKKYSKETQEILSGQAFILKNPRVPLPTEAEEILKKKKSVSCKYYNGLIGYGVFISDKQKDRKIRERITNNLSGYSEDLIVTDNGLGYRWNDRIKKGIVFLTQHFLSTDLFPRLLEMQTPSNSGILRCSYWQVQESHFDLPKEINFSP